MPSQANNTDIQFTCHHSIDEIDAAQWQALAVDAGPFLQYKWLELLEQTNCVTLQSGWQTAHFSAVKNGQLLAVVPGYIKTHSYGEYVFDHSWANAYHQHGLDYYPKWIAAIPFTPVTGPRILLSEDATADCTTQLLSHICEWAASNDYSSCHWLFTPPAQQADFDQAGYVPRYSVQFQWNNRGYGSFDDFMARLTSRKRRSIRKTRQRFSTQNVAISRLSGDNITASDMTFFVKCYQDTYLKRSGHTGYLTPAFFNGLFEEFADHLMLVKASVDDTDIAAALFLFDENGLYGRYWGCVQDIDELHFECCYFQGIEFAIERGLPIFNPGTQGEHKILRGFEPIYCVSQHKLLDLRFHHAVADFLHKEKPIIEDYFNQALDVLPFNDAYKTEFLSKP